MNWQEVDQSLQGAPGYPEDYDIDGILAEINGQEVDHDQYWEIVSHHDRALKGG